MSTLLRSFIVLVAIGALAAGAGWAQWQSVKAPELPPIAPPPPGSELLSWEVLGTARKKAGSTWEVPQELTRYTGKMVTIDGVLFVMPQLVSNGTMEGAVLTPPARLGCCAVGCDPRPERMVFVALTMPMPPPVGKTTPCRVTGRLSLDPSGESWTLATLEDATLTWSTPAR